MPIQDCKCKKCWRRWDHITVGEITVPVCPLCGKSEYTIIPSPPTIIMHEPAIPPRYEASDVTPLPDYEEEILKEGIAEEVEYLQKTKNPEYWKKQEKEMEKNNPTPKNLNFPALPTPFKKG